MTEIYVAGIAARLPESENIDVSAKLILKVVIHECFDTFIVLMKYIRYVIFV